MNRALLSSAKHDWETPESVLEMVRVIGPIALDPCTTPENPARATWFYTVEEDGLAHPWSAGALRARWIGGMSVASVDWLVYVNPPYGRELPKWIDKCVAEASRGVEILALVPARVDTRWYARCVETASAIRFWRGRLTFRAAPHPAPFPSALIYWGRRPSALRAAFGAHTLPGGVEKVAA